MHNKTKILSANYTTRYIILYLGFSFYPRNKLHSSKISNDTINRSK